MTTINTQPAKAVALISGGLDSLLAAKVIIEQGVHVEGINFYTGFCVEGHTHAIRKQDQKKQKRNNALWVAEQLGIKLHIIDISEPYKDIVLNPKHGYGQHLNPCLDCKVYMVNQALDWANENNFDFIITGEVIGQRPKSQRKETMPIIARESGAFDRLVRPLCAKHLPETLPEREGWITREKLYSFHGRDRRPQMDLAASFGFEEYAQPAGGCCFLTDENYASKLSDLWQARGKRDYELDDIMLLKVGRHIRPAPHYKMIIAREEGEGYFLEGYRKQFIHLHTPSKPGPLALIDGTPNEEDLHIAARIMARYSQARDEPTVDVAIVHTDGSAQLIPAQPFTPAQIKPEWYV
jgi:tRNA U34 2-thiouridine synthase MnmA/TrmU